VKSGRQRKTEEKIDSNKERERLGLMSTPAERERDEGDPPAGRGRDCDKRRVFGRLGAEGWMKLTMVARALVSRVFVSFASGPGHDESQEPAGRRSGDDELAVVGCG
jgi:hypothetical protein